MSEELKPCPYCNSPAIIDSEVGSELLRCSDPSGECPGTTVLLPCGNPENRAKSIAAWNRRAPRLEADSSTGQKTLVIKLLREALKSLPGGTAAIGQVAISNPAYAIILQQAFAGDGH